MNETGPELEYLPESPNLRLNWLEPFEWEEPVEWRGAEDLTGLAASMLGDGKIEAALWLLYNREKAQQLHGWRDALHTPPSAEHYRNTYLWDSGFSATMLAQSGEYAAEAAGHLESRLAQIGSGEERQIVEEVITELRELSERFIRGAVTESFWVVKGQKTDGLIPNLQFGKGRPRWFDIEWWFSADKINRSSNYSQPPVLALSSIATYKALRKADPEAARDFVTEMFHYLQRYFEFFQKNRTHSADNAMVGVVDPHETGMDSSIQWDYYKELRPKDKGPDHDPKELFETRIIDGAYAVMMQFERWLVAGLDQAKQREIFWALDISFNSIYCHNLQAMAWLAGELDRPEQAQYYKDQSERVEQGVLKNTWFGGEELDGQGRPKVRQKGFYSLRADGEPIDKITISNLFALLLPSLNAEQLESVLVVMDEHFDVPYPLPSCSRLDPAFDPHNYEKDRLWRGPTWQNTNWYLVEFGLNLHAGRHDISPRLRERCEAWADRIIEKSNELLDLNHQTEVSAKRALGGLILTRSLKDGRADRHKRYATGAREHYDSLTGDGQRDRVFNFSWSWLARYMKRRSPDSALSSPAS